MKVSSIVAIDGPAGAGKSAVSREVARRLGYVYLDTGAMYRAVGWLALKNGLDIANEAMVQDMLQGVEIRLWDERIAINGHDVTSEIRTPEIDKAASLISALPCVRVYLSGLQKEIGHRQDIVAEGRDMGTVVFPHAKTKIFLTASAEVRAKRRCLQLQGIGKDADYDETLRQIKARDEQDSSRQHSPMKPANDAVLLDTSNLTPNEVVEAILKRVQCTT